VNERHFARCPEDARHQPHKVWVGSLPVRIVTEILRWEDRAASHPASAIRKSAAATAQTQPRARWPGIFRGSAGFWLPQQGCLDRNSSRSRACQGRSEQEQQLDSAILPNSTITQRMAYPLRNNTPSTGGWLSLGSPGPYHRPYSVDHSGFTSACTSGPAGPER